MYEGAAFGERLAGACLTHVVCVCNSAVLPQSRRLRASVMRCLQPKRKQVFKRDIATRLASLLVKKRHFRWLLMLCCNPHSELHANVGI